MAGDTPEFSGKVMTEFDRGCCCRRMDIMIDQLQRHVLYYTAMDPKRSPSTLGTYGTCELFVEFDN